RFSNAIPRAESARLCSAQVSTPSYDGPAASADPTKTGRSVPLLLQLRQFPRRLLPLGGGGGELVDDHAQLAVEVLGLAGLIVGFGRFDSGGTVVLIGSWIGQYLFLM